MSGEGNEIDLFQRMGYPPGVSQAYRSAVERRAYDLKDTFQLPSLEVAFTLASLRTEDILLLAGGLQASRYERAARNIQSWPSVRQCAKIWSRYDLLAHLNATLFELQVMQRSLLVNGIGRTVQTAYYMREWWGTSRLSREDAMVAWIIVNVPGDASRDLWRRLTPPDPELAEVKEVGAVWGDEDMILRVEVTDNEHLRRLVYETLQGFDGVVATRTYICVEGTYWDGHQSSLEVS